MSKHDIIHYAVHRIEKGAYDKHSGHLRRLLHGLGERDRLIADDIWLSGIVIGGGQERFVCLLVDFSRRGWFVAHFLLKF